MSRKTKYHKPYITDELFNEMKILKRLRELFKKDRSDNKLKKYYYEQNSLVDEMLLECKLKYKEETTLVADKFKTGPSWLRNRSTTIKLPRMKKEYT